MCEAWIFNVTQIYQYTDQILQITYSRSYCIHLQRQLWGFKETESSVNRVAQKKTALLRQYIFVLLTKEIVERYEETYQNSFLLWRSKKMILIVKYMRKHLKIHSYLQKRLKDLRPPIWVDTSKLIPNHDKQIFYVIGMRNHLKTHSYKYKFRVWTIYGKYQN